MDPLAEFTKLEAWDQDGKPYLSEVSAARRGEARLQSCSMTHPRVPSHRIDLQPETLP